MIKLYSILEEQVPNPIDRLPIYKGRAYRSESGYTHDRNATALDVIKFEEDELGNTDDFKHLANDVRDALKLYSANDIIWVTKNKEDAEIYDIGWGVNEITRGLGINPRVVAEDGDGGYLVLIVNKMRK